MAARILRYTQCKTDTKTSTVPVEIIVRDTIGNIVPRTTFVQGSSGSLSTIAGTGVWDRIWTLTNPTTGEILTGTSDSYSLAGLSCGTWINMVDLIDRSTRQIVSTASNTITIECSEQRANPPLSVGITANPLIAAIGSPIDFASVVSGGNGVLSYRWDYGDGTTNTSSGSTSHSYTDNGAYTVILTITDASGNVARSSVVVVITGDRDTDRDGTIDIRDQCPLVYAQTVSGCPMIDTYADSTKTSTVSLEIVMRDASGNIVPRTTFVQGSSGPLSTIVGAGAGTWDRAWTLTNPTTGEILTGTSDSYPLAGLSCGSWINTVDLIDRTTRQIASTASNTITIECSEQRANPPLSVGITAAPLTATIGSPIDFASVVSGGS